MRPDGSVRGGATSRLRRSATRKLVLAIRVSQAKNRCSCILFYCFINWVTGALSALVGGGKPEDERKVSSLRIWRKPEGA
jgi:hypothetical protein